jgi:hypothetical protein
MSRAPARRFAILLLALAALPLAGCGVVWDSNGQRHAIGLGLVSWPLPNPARATIVHGVDVFGAAVLATRDTVGLVLGHERDRAVTLDGDRIVTLDCLDCDLAAAHAAGGIFPKETARP